MDSIKYIIINWNCMTFVIHFLFIILLFLFETHFLHFDDKFRTLNNKIAFDFLSHSFTHSLSLSFSLYFNFLFIYLFISRNFHWHSVKFLSCFTTVVVTTAIVVIVGGSIYCSFLICGNIEVNIFYVLH